ncbi:MAG: BON domain-containing protein [Proteobacteria bacterium]|nr:BON domain-containing protein [Desulfocapsa sp.]MBU3943945.1 BON domain-containing protein [Pseudomonadota bacterium]MCG2744964.1 BON domain-containing protein [Desulfobacteraceae bacterium]MBU4027954.1 BON domain-containing protein [Pseudomonadota bacterium]MBU4042440.1 BON domain-containing protein [Pseudomonadota bacterium]
MQKTTCRLALMVTAASLFLTNVPVFASETDNRIESSAKQSYVFKTYLKGDDIKIESKDGVATLTGTVSGEGHKLLAQETVASLPGVASVDNKLVENGEVPAVYTDAWLIAKVKSTLLFHRNLSATETEVLAENGTVTLRGEATSSAQKDLATEYVKDVEGVKALKNEMTVSTAGLKSSEKTIGQKMDAVGESIDDASVTALVKVTLLSHRSTSALNTTVETKDGMVKLGGKARNAAEKDLATKIVVDVPGVKSVFNNMTVEEAKTKETKTKKAAIEGC